MARGKRFTWRIGAILTLAVLLLPPGVGAGETRLSTPALVHAGGEESVVGAVLRQAQDSISDREIPLGDVGVGRGINSERRLSRDGQLLGFDTRTLRYSTSTASWRDGCPARIETK